jgi:hypothetical protein
MVFGQTLLDQVNDFRSKQLTAPTNLKLDKSLCRGSKRHVKKMIKAGGKLFHDYTVNQYEVVTNCDDPLNCFINSKPHRKILLTKGLVRIGYYSEGGITCIRLDDVF